MTLRRWSAAALMLFAAAAVAAPLSFGTRQLQIPEPDGYFPVAQSAPRFIDAVQAFLPASNRLVDAYTSAADRDSLVQGKAIDILRQFQLQVPRRLEGKLLSQQEFTEVSQTVDSEMKKAFANIGDKAKDLAAEGNARLKEKTGIDAGVSLSDIGYRGVYRHEDWGMFFSMTSKVGMTGSADTLLYCAGAVVLVDHQLLYLYSYSNLRSEKDAQWAQQSMSAWADAIHAANPDDPKLEAQAQRERGGFDWKQFAMMGAFGAIAGGLVAVFRGRRR